MVEECSSGVDGKYPKGCSVFEEGYDIVDLLITGYDYWVKLNSVSSILTLPGEAVMKGRSSYEICLCI